MKRHLHKIQGLIDMVVENFINVIPEGMMCIDDNMIPFRGRIIFKRFNKQKSHSYEIKVIKLCNRGC